MLFPATQKSSQKGFTLTELVIVIVIIGALAAAAIPRFINTQEFESRGFYEEVLSALRYAQKMAVGTGCNIQFTITTAPAPGSYGLFRETDCRNGNFVGGVSIDNPRTGLAYPTPAPDGVAFAAVTNFPVVFNPLGQAVNTPAPPAVDPPTATVTVGGRTITIWEETGLVSEP